MIEEEWWWVQFISSGNRSHMAEGTQLETEDT